MRNLPFRRPKLETFGIVANGHKLSGHLEGQGQLKTVGRAFEGGIRIGGGDFRLADFQAGPLSANVRIADNLATIEEFSLKLGGGDQIAVTGKAGLHAPFAYQAGLLIDVANLSALQPLLEAFNLKQAVGGGLHIDWNGSGDAVESPAFPVAPAGAALAARGGSTAPLNQTLAHSGRLGLSLTNGKMDKIALSEIRVSGLYSALEPEKPHTWKGNVTAKVDSITLDKAKIDNVAVAFDIQDGKGRLASAEMISGKNSVALTAQIALPESAKDLPNSDVDASLQISAPDLPRLTAMLPEPMTGTITGGGPLRLHGGKAEADLALDVSQLAGGKIGIKSANFQVKADKRIAPAPANPLDGLNSHVTAELTDFHAQDFTVDSAKLDFENQSDLVTLHTLEVSRAENSVAAHGSYRVPPDLKDAANSPVDAQFTIRAPKLKTFGIVSNGHPLSGHLDAQGELKTVGTGFEGGIQINGGDFRLADFQTGPLSVNVRVANNLASIEEFSLKLHGNDQIAVTGKAAIQPPFAYEGGLLIDLANLSALQPLLGRIPRETNGQRGLAYRLEWKGRRCRGARIASRARGAQPPFSRMPRALRIRRSRTPDSLGSL